MPLEGYAGDKELLLITLDIGTSMCKPEELFDEWSKLFKTR